MAVTLKKENKGHRGYRLLLGAGVLLILWGGLFSLHYIEALLRMDLREAWEVTARALPLLLAGGLCVACWHLHNRLDKIETSDLLRRVAQIETNLQEKNQKET